MPSKVYQSFSVSQNGVLVQFSTSWTSALNPLGAQQQCKNPVYASPQCYAGHPAEDSTLCWM